MEAVLLLVPKAPKATTASTVTLGGSAFQSRIEPSFNSSRSLLFEASVSTRVILLLLLLFASTVGSFVAGAFVAGVCTEEQQWRQRAVCTK